MFEDFISWFRKHVYPGADDPPQDLRETGVRVRPPGQRPGGASRAAVKKEAPKKNAGNDLSFESGSGSRIEDGGPGKNVLIRSKYVREDAGTHDRLKIIGDDDLEVSEEEDGIDPYNTGRFDRGKTWNNRTRK
ncbi:MAG: hypothetical protein WBN23_09685 [Woeseia sp.]